MTVCDDIRAGLDDWLDGLADADLRAEIDGHLATCPACAEYFERQRRLAGDLRALGGLADRIAAEEPARGARARTGRRWRAWPAAAAAACVVIAGGVYLSAIHTGPAPRQVADADKAPHGDVEPAERETRFRITVPEDRLAVPIESSNPKVHIVWLYNEIGAGRASSAAPPESSSSPD